MNSLKTKKGWRAAVGMLTVVFFAAGALAGCEPLRKKFVRSKKKEKTDEIIPVLDPVDYPSREQSPLMVYQYHYNLWKVWLKDFTAAMDEGAGDKRIASIMEQLDAQLIGMQEVVSGEDKTAFEGYRRDLQKVRTALEEPAALRDDRALKARVLRLDKELRANFSWAVMEKKLGGDSE